MIALTFLDQRYSKTLNIEISAQGHNVRVVFCSAIIALAVG
jgi:hypothetical protein